MQLDPTLGTRVLLSVVGMFADPAPTLGYGLCRLTLGSALVVDGVERWRAERHWTERSAAALAPDSEWPPLSRCLLRLDDLLHERRLLAAYLTFASAFALGAFTSISGALLLFTLVLLHRRSPFILYGGDALGRILVLLLLFAPSHVSLSLDSLWCGRGLGLGELRPPWAGRLIAPELALLYFSNFVHKFRCSEWRSGSALPLVLHNPDFAYAWVARSWRGMVGARLATWSVLAFELLAGPGLLLPQTASSTALLAIAFHAGIAVTMDVHLFSMIMIGGLMALVPMGASTTNSPSIAGELSVFPLTASGVALCYLAYIALSNTRTLLGSDPRRLGRSWIIRRGWSLFAPPAREAVALEIVAVDPKGTAWRYRWARHAGLQLEPSALPWAPGHRGKRFEFSLLKREEVRARFHARVRMLLRQRHERLRALAISLIYYPVCEAGVTRHAEGGVGLCLDVGVVAGAVDVEAAASLAASSRCAAVRAQLAALLASIRPVTGSTASKP